MNELRLSVPIEDIHLTPWHGVGRTIWEEVKFHNLGVRYTVYGAIDRALSENSDGEVVTEISGGIVVKVGERDPVHLACDKNSVDFPWGTSIFDAKTAKGQCFDRVMRVWRACE